jgi:hypothetical protein
MDQKIKKLENMTISRQIRRKRSRKCPDLSGFTTTNLAWELLFPHDGLRSAEGAGRDGGNRKTVRLFVPLNK